MYIAVLNLHDLQFRDHVHGKPVFTLQMNVQCNRLRDAQEDEAEKLMGEALPKNFIDYEEYPQTADIQNKCVNMVARLYNAPTAPGEENAMGTRYFFL